MAKLPSIFEIDWRPYNTTANGEFYHISESVNVNGKAETVTIYNYRQGQLDGLIFWARIRCENRDLKIEVFRHFPRIANVKKSRDLYLAVRFAVYVFTARSRLVVCSKMVKPPSLKVSKKRVANLLDTLSLIDKTKPLHFYPHRLNSSVLFAKKVWNRETPPRGPTPRLFIYHFWQKGYSFQADPLSIDRIGCILPSDYHCHLGSWTVTYPLQLCLFHPQFIVCFLQVLFFLNQIVQFSLQNIVRFLQTLSL